MPCGVAHRRSCDGHVGAEQVARDPERERAGDAVQHHREQQHAQVAVDAQRTPHRARAGAARESDEERQRAGGRCQRVGGDQVGLVDDVRERRGEAGEQEAVDRQARQDQHEQAGAVDVGTDRDREQPDQSDPDEVRPGQHLAPRPAVQEHPDEGSEHAERQQHEGQTAGDRPRRGCALGGEHDVRRQRDLEHAVGELAGEPDREQPTEPRPAQQVHEVAQGRHGAVVAGVIGRSRADPLAAAGSPYGADGSSYFPGKRRSPREGSRGERKIRCIPW